MSRKYSSNAKFLVIILEKVEKDDHLDMSMVTEEYILSTGPCHNNHVTVRDTQSSLVAVVVV